MSAYQIPLQIKLNDAATFANFFEEGNEHAVALVKGHDQFVYVWSVQATGKTHLLQALCHQSDNSIYLPIQDYLLWEPAIFEGLESYDVICLDNIEHIAGQAIWEEALFNLYNRVRDANKRLIVSAKTSPRQAGFDLADLTSRLSWGVTIQLNMLSDQQKVAALAMRANSRGFKLADEVVNYLLKFCPRDLHSLFQILEQLDDASLQAQRRITIPFIKQHLSL